MSDDGSAVVTNVRIPATGVRFFFYATKLAKKMSSTPAATSTAVRRTYLGISVGLHTSTAP